MNWDLFRVGFSLFAVLFACFACWQIRKQRKIIEQCAREIEQADREITAVLERLP